MAYLTAPDPHEKGYPKGIPFIIGNEGSERFSYYGMKSILWTYLAVMYCAETVEQRVQEHKLCEAIGQEGGMKAMSDQQLAALQQPLDDATATVHLFMTSVYAFPMIGALVADRLLGKYHTIISLSLVYCAGHAVLSVFEGSLPGIYLGLGLIALGAGGIKPCVSAHVGDQFGQGNWHLLERVFQAFYFIINFGAMFASLLIPLFKEWFGWSVAFAIPGVLMGLATLFFWLGRHRFVHVPPNPGGRLGLLDSLSSILLFLTLGSFFFTASVSWWLAALVSVGCLVSGGLLAYVRQRMEPQSGFLAVVTSALRRLGRSDPVARKRHGWLASALGKHPEAAVEGVRAVFSVLSVFVFVSVFWALFDQNASSWVRQAGMMDRTFDLPWGGSVTVLKEQVQTLNPILVMLLIPAVTFGLYPMLERAGIRMTPLRRMSAGMFLTSTSFVCAALIQSRIDAGANVSVAWQGLSYLLLTLSEVMVSVTGLEFAYTQAPRHMKSTIMGFWWLAVSLGNVLTALLAAFAGLELEQFFWAFAAIMAVSAVLFTLRAATYPYRDYAQ